MSETKTKLVVPKVEPTMEVEVVDVHVKAMRSTTKTQYYYLDKRFTAPPEDRCISRRHNITLFWVSGIPGFFECQREDGNKVVLAVSDLKFEVIEQPQAEG